MKRIIYIFFTLIALANLLTGCKDHEDKPDPAKAAAQLLQGTWRAAGGTVIVDGTDVTSDYATFTITFGQLKDEQQVYTVANGGYAFHDILLDTWTFTDSTLKSITRTADGIVMACAIDDDALTLQFTVPRSGESTGRMKGVFGSFTMKLQRD